MQQAANRTIEDQLSSPDYFANPYPTLRRLQQEAPIYWSEAWGAWVLTRYADNAQALRNPAVFSSSGRVSSLLRRLPQQEQARFEPIERHYRVGMTHSDPPDHTRLRGLLTKSFTPAEIEARRPRVQAVVDHLLEQVAERGEMDIIADLAYPLPAIIVAELLGAPVEDIGLLRDFAMGVNRLYEKGGRTSAAAAEATLHSLDGLRRYIRGLADERRLAPRDDVLSRLALAEKQDQITSDELVATAVTLFVAGHETTTYQLGNGLLALLQHPDQMDLLRRQPERIGAAVEEMLRYDLSVQRVWRRTQTEFCSDAGSIPAGELVLCMLGAANRDPAQFSEPDRFDIGRTDNRHIGFGVGIHFCLGAPLARLELPTTILLMLKRFPNLRLNLNEPLQWRHDVMLRGLNSLPVLL